MRADQAGGLRWQRWAIRVNGSVRLYATFRVSIVDRHAVRGVCQPGRVGVLRSALQPARCSAQSTHGHGIDVAADKRRSRCWQATAASSNNRHPVPLFAVTGPRSSLPSAARGFILFPDAQASRRSAQTLIDICETIAAAVALLPLFTFHTSGQRRSSLFSQCRGYRRSASPRLLNWKASAKRKPMDRKSEMAARRFVLAAVFTCSAARATVSQNSVVDAFIPGNTGASPARPLILSRHRADDLKRAC